MFVYVIRSMGGSKIWDSTTSVVLEIRKISRSIPISFAKCTHFQCNKSGVYPKLSQLYPCYSILISYSLTFVGVSMYAMYKLHY